MENAQDFEFDEVQYGADYDRLLNGPTSTGSSPLNFDFPGDEYEVVQEGGHGLSNAVLSEDRHDSKPCSPVEGGSRDKQPSVPRNMDDENMFAKADKRAYSPQEEDTGTKHRRPAASSYDAIKLEIRQLMEKIRGMLPTDSETALRLFNTTLSDLHSDLCKADLLSTHEYVPDSEIEAQKAHETLRQEIRLAETAREDKNKIILDIQEIAKVVALLDKTPSPTLSTYASIIPTYFKFFYRYQDLISENKMAKGVRYPSQQEHDFFLDVETRFIRFHFDGDYARLSFLRGDTNVLLLKNDAGKYVQEFGALLNKMKSYTTGKTQGHRMAWTRQFYPWCAQTDAYYRTYANIVPVLGMINAMATGTLADFKETHGTMRNYHNKLHELLSVISKYEETYKGEPALPSPEKRQAGWAPMLKYTEYIMWYATMESEKLLRKTDQPFSPKFFEVQMNIIMYEAAPDQGFAHIAPEIRCFFLTS